MRLRLLIRILLVMLCCCGAATSSFGQASSSAAASLDKAASSNDGVGFSVNFGNSEETDVGVVIQLLMLMTLLSIALAAYEPISERGAQYLVSLVGQHLSRRHSLPIHRNLSGLTLW